MQKTLKKSAEVLQFNAIAKAHQRAYTPCPHLPPLSNKVSQVEIEAGDCEGRLPLPFWNADARCEMLDARCADARCWMLELKVGLLSPEGSIWPWNALTSI